nr:uncharacterized protein LOC107436843 isoform X2 [Parasteatoda tepidariorum]
MQLSSRLLYFILSLLHFQLTVLAKVRGIPGVDYPNYSSIPKTSFKCPDFKPGFYADLETRCQVFHYCYEHRKESFLCQEGTIFNEAIKSCDYWYSSECDSTQTLYEATERKLKQSPYNDVPLVPVNAETNNIFDKMAALYEPKKHTENFMLKEQEEKAGNNYFEDLSDNGNENYETDSTYPLPAPEILLNEMTENSLTEDNISDFVKYEHDSVEGDGVDIRFHDNSVQIFPYNNNEVYISSIGSLSETESSYLNQDTTTDKKNKYERYNTEEQNKLFTTHYPQPLDNINFSDHESSGSLLIKRLSDNSDVPKKRFRRKPTYVVLQTQESDESTSKSTAYGVEQNQAIKDVYGDKSNAYHHTFLTESPTPGIKETETKLKEDLVQKSDRKFRRNRKTLQTFTDQSENLQNEAKFAEEYQPTKDIYIDAVTVYQSSHKESTLTHFPEAGKNSENIKMSVKKPRQNRKKIHMLVDEPDEENDETKELVKEYETIKNVYSDKENAYHSLQTNTDSFILDKVTENKPEVFNISAGKPILNKTLGMYIGESKKTNAELTESTKLNQEFIMPANIMSPSFETDEEPVILVSNDTTISEAHTFITQPAITQAAISITPIAPDSITILKLIENELEDADVIMKNFSHVEEPHISSHELKTSETDVMNKEPHIHESNPASVFEKVTQNNQNFIPLLLNMNSKIEDQTYSEQDTNLASNKNMHSEVQDNVYLEEEINSDTISMNSADEDLIYSEQEISSDNTLYVDSAADTAYSEQETYPHHIVNMDSEFEELEHSGEEMNLGDIVTHVIDDQSHAISYEILKSGEQADQYEGQNNYGNGEYGFSGAYDMFSQTIDSDSNNYVLISTLSPIAITDESSTADFLDEDNNKHNVIYENSDSFEDEQMHYVNNLKAMYPEHEGLMSVDEEINSDMNAAISDLINEDETKSFADKTEDFDSNEFHEISNNVISTESTSFREDVYSDDVENAELYGLEKGLDLNTKENVPLQEETGHYKEQQHFFDFESSTTSESIPKNIMEISNRTNSFYNESFESSIVVKDSKYENEVERVHIAKTPEELFKTSTVVDHLNNTYADKNSPFSKISEKSFGSSTFVEGSRDNKTYEYGTNAKNSEESLENFYIIEDLKDINKDENAPFAKSTDTDSTEAEFFHIYPSADDQLPSKSFDEQDVTTLLTKTRKGTLLETNLQNEAEISDNLNSHLTENENGAFNELILNKFKINQANTMKATSGFVEESQGEEEKPIDSVFHSSSMPLPANIFEQGLYKQNLLQDENYQINRDKIYPSTFYKELDESQEKPKNEKSAVVNTSHNKKYRSLNSNFPLDEMNLENVDDLSSKYREPSLLSLFEPSQTVKKLLPIDFFGLKSSSIFSPPVGKISKPIEVKKLVAFGKNLLAFKRAKLNDFKLMFDSFMNEI